MEKKLAGGKRMNIKIVSLIFVFCFTFFIGFKYYSSISLKYRNNVYQSNESSADLEINVDRMLIRIADSYADMTSCETVELAKCVIFDSTIMFVPDLTDISNLSSEKNIIENKALSIEYTFEKKVLDIHGKKVHGYHIETIGVDFKKQVFKGNYFYSEEIGVSEFVHFKNRVRDGNEIDFKFKWFLVGEKGLFNVQQAQSAR